MGWEEVVVVSYSARKKEDVFTLGSTRFVKMR